MNNKPFTNNLREHRTKAGLLQRDVASSLGLDCADRLSRWENGSAVPHIVNLFKLAALYRVEPHELYATVYDNVRREIGRSESVESNAVCDI